MNIKEREKTHQWRMYFGISQIFIHNNFNGHFFF